MRAGVRPQPALQPVPKHGPLSYLSTVTTMASSDWGSQSLQRLSPQPSLLARQSSGLHSPGASVTPAKQGSLAQQPSRKPTASAQQGSLAQRPPSTARSLQQPPAAAIIEAASVQRSNGQQAMLQTRSFPYSKSSSALPTGFASSSEAAFDDGSTTAQPRQAEKSPSEAVSSDQSTARQSSLLPDQAHTSSDQSEWATEDADWGAFDSEPTSLPAAAASGMQSRSSLHNTQQDWSAFGQEPGPSSVQNGQQLAQTSSRVSQYSPAQSAAPGTSNSLQHPSAQPDAQFDARFDADPWQANERTPGQPTAGPAPDGSGATAGPARMGSGDSFGDFDAAGGRAGFESSDWHTAPALPPDPFAASASFKDFTALLDLEANSAAAQGVDTQLHTDQPPANGALSSDPGVLQIDGDAIAATQAWTGAYGLEGFHACAWCILHWYIWRQSTA